MRKGTLLFLALPQIIFFLGWMRLPLAALICALLCFAVWQAGFRERNARRTSWMDGENLAAWLVAVVLPALILTLCSGVGGWGGGDSDWLKHDTLLRDLVTRSWPVNYQTDRGPVLLVYYLAFYLPAALLGKLAGPMGYAVASQALALTTWVGLTLSAGWLVVLGRQRSRGTVSVENNVRLRNKSSMSIWVGAAIFFGFSGLDPLGKMLVNLYLGLPALYGDWSDVEWWAQFAQYSSNAATAFWAPQHAFGGWLSAALVVDDWLAGHNRLEGSWVLYLSCAALWSPFAAVGLAALVGCLFLWRWWWAAAQPAGSESRDEHGDWRRCLTWTNAAGSVAGTCLASYLLAHFQSFYLPAAYCVTPGRHPVPLLDQSEMPWTLLYLGFVAIEFGGFSFVLAFALRDRGDDDLHAVRRSLLAAASVVLLVLPWFHYGFANDLVMRGGIPALFVLQILTAYLLISMAQRTPASIIWEKPRWPAVVAGCLLLGGLVNVGLEYRRHLARMISQGGLRDARTTQPVRTLAELQRTIYARPGFDFSRQYLGSADSFYARHLARRGVIPQAGSAHDTVVDFEAGDP